MFKFSNLQNSGSVKWIFHVLMPILIGGLIYLGFRSENLLMFRWFEAIQLDELIHSFRLNIHSSGLVLPDWAIFSLPDGLWVYAFTSALIILWNERLSWWLLIPLITGLFIELGQAFKFIEGTFDFVDLFLSLLAFIGSIFILNYKKNQYEKTVS